MTEIPPDPAALRPPAPPEQAAMMPPVPHPASVQPVAPIGTVSAAAPPAGSARGMYTAAAVINWVTLGIIIVSTLGVGIIAAAWFVPMTILIHKGAKGPYKHTALGVCTLIFCNLVSGILMLVDDGNRPDKPTA